MILNLLCHKLSVLISTQIVKQAISSMCKIKLSCLMYAFRQRAKSGGRPSFPLLIIPPPPPPPPPRKKCSNFSNLQRFYYFLRDFVIAKFSAVAAGAGARFIPSQCTSYHRTITYILGRCLPISSTQQTAANDSLPDAGISAKFTCSVRPAWNDKRSRVARSGGWNDLPMIVRSAYRHKDLQP